MKDQGRRGRLPTDDAYWTSLAERAIAAVFERDTSRTSPDGHNGFSRSPWWTPLANAGMRITAAAVVALIAAALLQQSGPPQRPDGNAMRAALVPADPMLQSLMVESTEAPSASALIGLLILREGDR